MTDLVDLVLEPPDEGLYVLLHPDQRLDFFLSVQMAIVDDTVAQWGVAHWGVDTWAEPGGHWKWLDMTGFVRGLEWTRGATGLSDRPEVGTCAMTLAWGGGFLDIVENTSFPHADYLRNGTLWRVVMSAPSAYGLPAVGGFEDAYGFATLFTGVVESIAEHSTTQWADAWLDVILAETASLAAAHDDPAVPVRGVGDSLEARLNRILGIDPPRTRPWEFGLVGSPWGEMADFVTFQSTNLAESMLTEAYRSVDTVHFDLYTDRSGALRVTERSIEFEWYTGISGDALVFSLHPGAEDVDTFAGTAHIPYDIDDGLGFEKNTDDVANVVIAAAVDGLEQTVHDSKSRRMYGQRTTGRDDLLMLDRSAHVQEWARRELDVRKQRVLHCGPVRLDAAMGSTIGEALATLDLHTLIEVNVPNRAPVFFLCGGYTMSFVPLDDKGNATWTAEVSLIPTIEGHEPGTTIVAWQVQTLAGDGTFQTDPASPLTLVAPSCACQNPITGDIFVVEPSLHRVRKITTAGVVSTLSSAFTADTTSLHWCYFADGRLWVTDQGGGGNGAGILYSVDPTSGALTTIATGLDQPQGVAVTADGLTAYVACLADYWFGTRGSDLCSIVTSSGVVTHHYQYPRGDFSAFDTIPMGVTFAPGDENLVHVNYVARSEAIDRYDVSLDSWDTVSLASVGLLDTSGLAALPLATDPLHLYMVRKMNEAAPCDNFANTPYLMSVGVNFAVPSFTLIAGRPYVPPLCNDGWKDDANVPIPAPNETLAAYGDPGGVLFEGPMGLILTTYGEPDGAFLLADAGNGYVRRIRPNTTHA